MTLLAAEYISSREGFIGKFSIPYCVANALIRGNTGMQAFTDEKVNAPEIRELMKKISLEVDEKLSSLEARIELETKAEKVYSRVTDIIKDIPELNVKEVKIKSKFVDLCDPVLGQKRTEELMEAVLSLEKIESMKSIVELVHT
jgi:2-methylcitrate dehydratase PrpD